MSVDPRLRRRRWLIYGVVASMYFVSCVHRVAPAVVAVDLMRAFSITAESLGTLAATYPYTFVVMALVAGSLVDTLGPRWTLTMGALTMGAGAVVFGLAPVFAVAFGGRLLVGLGASVILISWLGLLAEWFRPDEFAMMSGSTQIVGNAGVLMASAPLALLVETLGWRETFVLVGVVTAMLAGTAAAVVRDRPALMGMAPVGPRTPRPASLGDVLRGIPTVLGNVRSWPPVLAAAGIYATEIAFLGLWGVPYLMQVYGFDRVRAANTLALVAIGMMIGTPLMGWLSDRWLGRRRLPFIAFTMIYAACWLPLGLPGWRLAADALPPLLFLMGVSSSAFVLVWACAREVNDPGRVGIVVGFANGPIFLGFALLQWLMGAVLDARWAGLAAGGVRLYGVEAYEAAFGLCLGVSVVALLCAALMTETRCRNIWTARTANA